MDENKNIVVVVRLNFRFSHLSELVEQILNVLGAYIWRQVSHVYAALVSTHLGQRLEKIPRRAAKKHK